MCKALWLFGCFISFVCSKEITYADSKNVKQVLDKKVKVLHGRYGRDIEGFPVILSGNKNFWISTNETSKITVGDRISGIAGSHVIISCPFKGVPYPRATWFFNDNVVDHVQFKNIDITEPKGVSVLTLHRIDNDHSGEYKCMVFNAHGRAESIAYVRMIEAWQPTIFSERLKKVFKISETLANISVGVDATLYEGTEVFIYCNVKSKKKIQIEWKSDLSSEKFQTLVRDTTVLKLGTVSIDDAGSYTCVVNGGMEKGDQQQTVLTILGKRSPVIDSRNDSVRYIRGSSVAHVQVGEFAVIKAGLMVKIACPYTAMPPGKSTWRRNGMALALPSHNIYVEKYRNQLVIENIEVQHSDNFTCIVENTIGRASASSKIKVIPRGSRSPRISAGRRSRTTKIISTARLVPIRIGETVQIIEGAPLKLICSTSGLPKPEISWELNRKPVLDDSIIQTGNTLLILHFQRKHVGDYKCKANNVVGEARAWSDVRMIVPSAPTIEVGKSFLKIAEKGTLVDITIGDKLKTTGGRDIVITCPTTGYPIAKLLWKHGKNMVTDTEKVIQNNKKRTLTLKNADEWSSGIYSCFATNGAGVAMSSSEIKILPKGAPLITSKEKVEKSLDASPLVDIEIGTNLTTTLGKTLRILCPAEGTEQSYYEWTVNGKQLHYDTRINLNNGYELIINGLQFFDEGIYGCRAYSQYGYDKMISQIKIIAGHTKGGKSQQHGNIGTQGATGDEFHVTSGQDIKVISGQSVEIRCPARGSLRPQLTWLKDNQPIIPSRVLVPKGEKLYLSNVDISSRGQYTCVMQTQLGISQLVTNIEVIKFQKLQIHSVSGFIEAVDPTTVAVITIGNNARAIKGVTIKIKCPHIAVPPAKISWLVNSKEIEKNDRSFVQEKGTDALLIQKMSEKYTGIYTCRGEQNGQITEASSHLQFIEMESPVIRKSQRELHTFPTSAILHAHIGDLLTVNLGKFVQIDCLVNGVPKPHVTWKFNEKDLSLVSGVKDFKNGSITIKLANWWHSGKVKCFSVNSVGVDSAISNIDVVGKYLPIGYEPIIKNIKFIKAKKRTISVEVGTNITTVAGNSILLICPVGKYGKVDIIWEKEGLFFQGTRYYTNGTVFISSLKVKDSGSYTCFSDDARKWKFGSLHISVLIPVEELLEKSVGQEIQILTNEPKEIEVTVGTQLTTLHGNKLKFKCPIREGVIGIDWLQNGRIISSGDKYFVVKEKLKIGMHNVTCQVTGEMGKTEITSFIQIQAERKIQVKNPIQNIMSTASKSEFDVGGSVHVLQGSSVDLNCLVSGSPLPEVQWSHNGVPLRKSQNLYFKRRKHTLAIQIVSQINSGIYKCGVVDTDGKEYFSTLKLGVYVPKKPTIVSSKQGATQAGMLGRPTEVIIYRNRTTKNVQDEAISVEVGNDYKIISGAKLKLVCIADGVPKPTMKWKKDGVELLNTHHSLVVDTTDIRSNGMYVCAASNRFGAVTESSLIDIILPSKPVIQRDLARGNKTEFLSHMDGSTKVEVFIGDDLKTISGTIVCIRCPAIGIPRPKISFLKDEIPVELNNKYAIDDLGSLIITSASKADSCEGVYTCHAENEAGFDELNTTLVLYDPVKPAFLPATDKPKYSFNSVTGKGVLQITSGQSVITYPNTLAYIKCPVSGFPFPVVIWEKDDKVLANSGIAVLKNNATTLIYEIHQSSLFRCTATNMAGSQQVDTVITVEEPLPPKILVQKFEVVTAKVMSANITIGNIANILSGSRLTITCPSVGSPKPTIIWSHDSIAGTWLEEHPNVHFALDGHHIIISNISKEFEGGYRCNATNVFGADTQLSYISVIDHTPPTLTVSDQKYIVKKRAREIIANVGSELHVLRNTRVLLDCPVSGFPPPKVTWLKDGTPLRRNIDYDPLTHILTLNNVKLTAEGRYTCVAETFAKTLKADTMLYVGYTPTIKAVSRNLSPLISVRADSELVIPVGVKKSLLRIKSTAVFQCTTQGHPHPNISWYFNDFPIDLDNKDKYDSLISSLLYVKRVVQSDAGIYSCQARNIFGEAVAKTTLSVMVPPRILSKNENITRTKYSKQILYATVGGSIITVKGMSIIITCPVAGAPYPVVKWSEANSSFVIDPRIYVTFDSHFRMNNVRVSDSGRYTCTATNKVGEMNRSTYLLVAEKPTAAIFPHFRSSKTRKTNAVSNGDGKLIVPLKSHIRLLCHVTGSPTPKITWLKDHDLVRTAINRNELEVEFVTYQDGGTYVCMADNVLGATTALMEVTIGVPPNLMKGNSSVNSEKSDVIQVRVGSSITLHVGSTLRISCNASGNPKPELFWNKYDGTQLVTVKTGSSNVLILRNFTKNMAGRYICRAKNMLGEDVASTNVSVIEGAKIVTDIPKRKKGDFVVNEKTEAMQIHVIEGQRLHLICYGAGHPLPNISFQRLSTRLSNQFLHNLELADNVDTVSNQTQKGLDVSENLPNEFSQTTSAKRNTKTGGRVRVAEIFVKSIKLRHSGKYTCKVGNTVGQDYALVELYVYPFPEAPYTGVWKVIAYNACDKPCVGSNYGTQTRSILCISFNGKEVNKTNCDHALKPPLSKKCFTPKCRTSWSVGDWSKCSQTCGKDGIQERTPFCVYSNSRVMVDPKNCPVKNKPTAMRKCNVHPCSKDECSNRFQYCPLMKKLGFCRMETYKTLCCSSCVEYQP